MALRMFCRRFAASGASALSRSGTQASVVTSKAAGTIRQVHCLAAKAQKGSSKGKPPPRGFASSPLADVLKSELDYELENIEKAEGLEEGPPEDFKLTETPGDTLLLLTRQYKGETIEVTVSVNDQPEEDFDEEEEAEDEADSFPGLNFEVAVIKGDQRLIFECLASGSDIEIERAALEPAEGDLSDDYYYGPLYQELDDKLQEEFANYLHQRGIDEALGDYLITLVNDKEEQEYRRWLGNVRKFVLK